GEGKTLVATLPVFLNALTGRGVHVVTVNDYLARRDSEWMGPLYMFHGLSVDCIDKSQPNSPERRAAYHADITFGTNNEFGFDYLRDNMAIHPEDLVQRQHNYAIVDEVDSVLIDDARTPLIISGPVPKGEDQMFEEYKPRVERLVKMQRELVTRIFNEAKTLLASDDRKKQDEGAVLLLRAHKGLPKYKPLIKFLSEQGNKATLVKTENVYMQENNRRMPEITEPLYFVIDEKLHSIDLTDKGHDTITAAGEDPAFFVLPDIGSELADIDKLIAPEDEKIARKDALTQNYAIKSERIHTVSQLLKAYTLFELDVEYVVIDNKVKIVDEQTGRIMEGRRYSDGLHQAIEAKENVKVEAATQTFATITLQNYFRMYRKLAGMTGTAETEAGEFWNIYKLDVVVIPTNKPIIRKDANDYVFKTKREKYNAIIDEIVHLVDAGRPVLVGTTSVEISELLSRMLKMRGIKHNVLNAKLHQREADIVAEAGKSRVVTIATNMAGRGTDIKLSQEVREAGGLAIIGTERHDSRRVDRQLRGRAGRQGDPGTSQFFVSLEDDLMRLFSSGRIISVMDRLGHKEGDVIQHSLITRSIEKAQKKVEENNFGIRKRLLEYDDVMNSQREVIYKKRRHALLGERVGVDIANNMYDVCEALVEEFKEGENIEQLRESALKYLSVNYPNLIGETAKRLPDASSKKLSEHSRKTETIAPKKSEEEDYAIDAGEEDYEIDAGETDKRPAKPRERDSRKADAITRKESETTGAEDYAIEAKEFAQRSAEITTKELYDQVRQTYYRKVEAIARQAFPVIKQVYETRGEQYKNIVVPFTDGFRTYQVITNLEKSYNTGGEELVRSYEKAIILSHIDDFWKEHLREMDDLKHAVQNASIEQKDPLLIYKFESFNLFKGMVDKTNKSVVSTLMKGQIPLADPERVRKAVEQRTDLSQLKTERSDAPTQEARKALPQPKTETIRVGPKVGRNDPCPCGSGKKYKNCHGQS
ncbi:MAG: SEC-C domain-containing protein, partial [Odoribacteraceae bacterium]|nr:SEC-C domain-containing protein [Odoribacteraceae bacterium]